MCPGWGVLCRIVHQERQKERQKESDTETLCVNVLSSHTEWRSDGEAAPVRRGDACKLNGVLIADRAERGAGVRTR